MNPIKQQIAELSNKSKVKGNLEIALTGMDVFVGVSVGNIVTEAMIERMNHAPFIFAMANPEPEIMPELAYKAGASVVGTGRSDLQNQVNNALVFPGLFKGLFKAGIKKVTPEIKIAVATAIAYSINPTRDNLMPSIFNKEIVEHIVHAIEKSAISAAWSTIELPDEAKELVVA